MTIVAINIAPLGSGTSVSRYVVEAGKVFAAKKNIKMQIGPMFTTLEGDLSEILDAIKEAQEAVFTAGALRVTTTIKIDERRDKSITMEGKVQAVEQKLQNC